MGFYRSSKYKGVCQARDRSSDAIQIQLVLQPANPQILEVTCCAGLWGSFLVAIVAAIVGFSGVVVAAGGIAKILFFLFLFLCMLTLIGDQVRRT